VHRKRDEAPEALVQCLRGIASTIKKVGRVPGIDIVKHDDAKEFNSAAFKKAQDLMLT